MSGRQLLFHRDFRQYTGGHGKVWDYFNHALALGWDARVYLTPDSRRDVTNPWMAVPQRIEPQWQPAQADVLFLGGNDWAAVPDGTEQRVPVVNLIQGVRHADPALPLHGCLARKAVRICVGQPVADAILATGRTHGPVQVIPAALDLPGDIAPPAAKTCGVLIAAQKNPQLGRALAERLRARGVDVELMLDWMPRPDYLRALAQARVAAMLPLPAEGFFLPGLEAMALGCAVVMPDAIGNRQYAIDRDNCLMPAADPDAIAQAVAELLDDVALRTRLVSAAAQVVARHGPAAERAALAAVLAEIDA